MVDGCSVPGCKNKQPTNDSDVSYFRFPTDLQMKVKWMVKVFGNLDFKNSDCQVCSEHFKKEDFEEDIAAKLLNLPHKKILKEKAIPSLNLPSATAGAALKTTIVSNTTNSAVSPVGIIIYQYNIQDSNIQNSTIESNNLQSSNVKPKSNVKDRVKLSKQVKIKNKIEEKLKHKIDVLKADLRAEKHKSTLLQRKMEELKSKVNELHSAATDMMEEKFEEKISRMCNSLASKSPLGSVFRLQEVKSDLLKDIRL